VDDFEYGDVFPDGDISRVMVEGTLKSVSSEDALLANRRKSDSIAVERDTASLSSFQAAVCEVVVLPHLMMHCLTSFSDRMMNRRRVRFQTTVLRAFSLQCSPPSWPPCLAFP